MHIDSLLQERWLVVDRVIYFFVGAAKGISEGISEGVNEETHENNLQASDSKNSSNMTEITNNTNITLN